MALNKPFHFLLTLLLLLFGPEVYYLSTVSGLCLGLTTQDLLLQPQALVCVPL